MPTPKRRSGKQRTGSKKGGGKKPTQRGTAERKTAPRPAGGARTRRKNNTSLILALKKELDKNPGALKVDLAKKLGCSPTLIDGLEYNLELAEGAAKKTGKPLKWVLQVANRYAAENPGSFEHILISFDALLSRGRLDPHIKD